MPSNRNPIEFEFYADEDDTPVCEFHAHEDVSVIVQLEPNRTGIKFAQILTTMLEGMPANLYPNQPEKEDA